LPYQGHGVDFLKAGMSVSEEAGRSILYSGKQLYEGWSCRKQFVAGALRIFNR